jgi:hypothetical protein
LADKGLLDPPYASTERGGYNLLQREFDSLFFLARNEIVSLDNAGTSVPAKERIVVAGRTKR